MKNQCAFPITNALIVLQDVKVDVPKKSEVKKPGGHFGVQPQDLPNVEVLMVRRLNFGCNFSL